MSSASRKQNIRETNSDRKGGTESAELHSHSSPLPVVLALSVIPDMEQSPALGCLVAQGIFKRQG